MAKLDVIPTPLAQRWRDFRIQFIPMAVFLIAAVIVALVWEKFIFPATLVGRVEAVQCPVASTKAGIVTKLYVTRFQNVAAGDPIAEVAVTETNILTASLNVIRAEINNLQVGMAPMENWQRNVLNYDQLRLEWFRQRADAAEARSRLITAESEYQRMGKLHQAKLVSDTDFEIAQQERDRLLTRANELDKLVTTLDESMTLHTKSMPMMSNPTNQLQAAMAVEEEKLKYTEELLKPIVLRAPIDGMVVMISQFAGETVVAGGDIATISATRSERIIGYLRQPLYITPVTNMAVQVRSRSFQRVGGMGRILAIGGQMQPINDVLLPPTKYNVTEQGLPILVSLPEELKSKPGQAPKVRPGELLDLTIINPR